MKAIVITTDDRIGIVELSAPLLDSIRKIIDGFVEVVHPMGLMPPYCIAVNDEGMIRELPLNRIGCLLYGTHFHGSPIVGNIVVLKEGMTASGRDFVPMDDGELDNLFHVFKGFELKTLDEKEFMK